jgi:hypothetical protein
VRSRCGRRGRKQPTTTFRLWPNGLRNRTRFGLLALAGWRGRRRRAGRRRIVVTGVSIPRNQVAFGVHALLVGDVVAALGVRGRQGALARSRSRADDSADRGACAGAAMAACGGSGDGASIGHARGFIIRQRDSSALTSVKRRRIGQ